MAARKTYGKTWWGQAWIQAMERVDYDSNRLPRGKRYANGGMVTEIIIKNDTISAKVEGSRRKPYDVKINLKKFTKAQTTRIKKNIATDPALASEMELGQLPPEILTLLESQKIHLLPTSWKDITANCSCPDWANPCKHLAAVYYIIANEIDKNPFLLFTLRGLGAADLLQAAGFVSLEKTAETKKEAFIPYQELKITAAKPNSSSEFPLNLSSLAKEKKEKTILNLLADSPLFYSAGNFKAILLQAYKNIATSLEHLVLLENGFSFKNTPFYLLYPPGKTPCPWEKTAFFALPEKNLPENIISETKTMPFPLASNGELTLKRKKGELIPAASLLDLFLKLPLEISTTKNSPAAIFLSAASAVAQALAQSSSFFPEIKKEQDGSFFITYVPLTRTKEAREAIDYLASIIPLGFIFRKKSKTVLPPRDAVLEVLALFLTHLVHSFADIKESHKICQAFFQGKNYLAQEFEEKQTAKAIADWLARVNLQFKKVAPVVKITLPPPRQEGFHLDIAIENKEDPLAPPLPLTKIFKTQKNIFSLPADTVRQEVSRQVTIAAAYFPALKKILSSKGIKPLLLDPPALAEFLTSGQSLCALLGLKIIIPKELKTLATPQISIEANSKKEGGEKVSYLNLEKMLSFSWKIAVGDLLLTKKEFKQLANSAAGIVKFKDSYLLLDPTEVQNILAKLNDPLPHLSSAEILRSALTGEVEDTLFTPDEMLKKMLSTLQETEPVAIPENLNATLRPYQKRGFKWLYSNLNKGLGSCLADDMGLGKTIQVIALALKLQEEKKLNSPILVVCPTTLVGNWEKECARFAPSLRLALYHGPKRRLTTANIDLIITTYGTVRQDITKFKKKTWNIVVIDEAQNIKNSSSAQSKAVASLPAGACIAMSGTPVENRLTELWSIFNFLNKGYFGSQKEFVRRFALPIEKYRDQEKIITLKKAIAPFILRRMKSDKTIIKDLPNKVVKNEYCYLTKEQAALYQQIVDSIMQEIESSEGIARKGLVFKLMTSLKQICNHPVHYTKKGSATKEYSGKAEKTISLLQQIRAAQEKVLLFTQYKEMGNLLVEMIKQELQEEVPFFHGGLSRQKRDKMIVDFQEKNSSPIMIISLKAGGTGLNLTTASNVIHYDLWWNPAVEDQATDRTYRIGQTKNVIVHRLITIGTFEEKINEMLLAKKELADLTVSSGEKWLTEMSNQELLATFKLARQ